MHLPRYPFEYVGGDPNGVILKLVDFFYRTTNGGILASASGLAHIVDQAMRDGAAPKAYTYASGTRNATGFRAYANGSQLVMVGIAAADFPRGRLCRIVAELVVEGRERWSLEYRKARTSSLLSFVIPQLHLGKPEAIGGRSPEEAHPAFGLLSAVWDDPLDALSWAALRDSREDDGPAWEVVRPTPSLRDIDAGLEALRRLADESAPYEEYLGCKK